MKYIHYYDSVEDAIGKEEITPFVGVAGDDDAVFASTNKGEKVKLSSDGEGYFKADAVTA